LRGCHSQLDRAQQRCTDRIGLQSFIYIYYPLAESKENQSIFYYPLAESKQNQSIFYYPLAESKQNHSISKFWDWRDAGSNTSTVKHSALKIISLRIPLFFHSRNTIVLTVPHKLNILYF